VSPFPAPPGGSLGTFAADDGALLRHGLWPREAARGTVLTLGGFTEFIEKYLETVQDLLGRGFAVAALDWRSQGLSHRALANRHKIHADDFARHALDLRQFLERVVAPRLPGPYVVLAHSMGGHIALRYLHERPPLVRAAVLSAPMLDIALPRGLRGAVAALTGAGVALGLGSAYALGHRDYGAWKQRFEGNRLTSDPVRFARAHAAIAADPQLASGGATFGWVRAALRSIRLFSDPAYLAGFATPICIVQAGDDRVVCNTAQERFARHVRSCELHRIDGARHELLQERDELRDRFWAIFDAFVARHL
jgi:lysophospholipase